MKPPSRTGSPNDFQTPTFALDYLTQYLPKGTIWECAAGKGNLVRGFQERGYEVVGTDLLTGHSFLDYEPETYDIIVTNPPFSIKDEFLKRAYELEKPFAFLLPLTTFEGLKRQPLFRKYGVQVIFPEKRINFETPSGNGSGSWFFTAWFTHGFNLPHDLIFVEKSLSPPLELEMRQIDMTFVT